MQYFMLFYRWKYMFFFCLEAWIREEWSMYISDKIMRWFNNSYHFSKHHFVYCLCHHSDIFPKMSGQMGPIVFGPFCLESEFLPLWRKEVKTEGKKKIEIINCHTPQNTIWPPKQGWLQDRWLLSQMHITLSKITLHFLGI